jgi:hypothetical protein
MTRPDTALEAELGGLMSEFSEACWSAGWLEGTEYMVPELCRRAISSGESQPWAHGHLTLEQALAMTGLAKQLGHWVRPSDDGTAYVPFSPGDVPSRYIEDLDHWLHQRSS